MKTRLRDNTLVVLFVIATFVLALNKIVAYDAWLHLSLGRLIWELKGLPQTEPFTYPLYGHPFSYNSWLFGLLVYAIYQNFGSIGLVLLKALVVTTAFYVLFADALRPYKNYALTALVMTAGIFLSHMRFVLRPDIFFMFYLGFSIFSLNAFMYEDKKYIYALPLTHLLWANMHASIIVMFGPFLSFIVGSYVQKFLHRKGIGEAVYLSAKQIRTVTFVFIASFIASCITPFMSLHQYIYGPKYETSAWHTHHIVENLYPEQVLIGMLGVTVIVLISFLLNRKRFNFIYAMLLVPFIVVSFYGHRFVFVIAIVGFPILARNLSGSLESRGVRTDKVTLVAIMAACLMVFGTVSVKAHNDARKFGFGFDYSEMPKGAVEYLDENGIYGRVLNQYRFGQYITWDSYPRRPVFIDGRGHLPVELLDDMLYFRTRKGILGDLYKTYGFDYIVTEYLIGQMSPFIPTTDEQWALVYWDNVSLVYLKRGDKYKDIIERDEYKTVQPEVSPIRILDRADETAYLDDLMGELKRNIEDTGSARARVLMGYALLAKGSVDKAKESLEAAVRLSPANAEAQFGIGLAYERLGDEKSAKKHLKLAKEYAKYPYLKNLADSKAKSLLSD